MRFFASVCAGFVFVFLITSVLRLVLPDPSGRVELPWSEEELRRKVQILLNQIDLEDRYYSPALKARLAGMDVEEIFTRENFNNFPDDYGAGFRLTPQHVVLLRHVRLAWDDVENGAPKVVAHHPFGQEDPFEAMRVLFGAKTVRDQAKAYGLMHLALRRFLSSAELAPGTYRLKNVTPHQLFKTFDGFFLNADLIASPKDIGLDADGRVIVDADMLKLIREMPFYWPSEEEMQVSAFVGEWPVPLIDGKRPYAQSSWHETDMQEILTGEDVVEDKDGNVVFPDGRERQLTLMHFRTLAVMQVFFENAVLPNEAE
ncbi:hypothetical protein [Roseibium sp.]|uniref:hypothetical protein n=1 Tax=Roseibium sp. TaxID=1936156 RepID=UPI003BAEFB08